MYIELRVDDKARSMLCNEPLPTNKYTHGQHRDTAFLTLKINVQQTQTHIKYIPVSDSDGDGGSDVTEALLLLLLLSFWLPRRFLLLLWLVLLVPLSLLGGAFVEEPREPRLCGCVNSNNSNNSRKERKYTI